MYKSKGSDPPKSFSLLLRLLGCTPGWKEVIMRAAYISIPHDEDCSPPAPGSRHLVQHLSWPEDEARPRLIMISFVMLIMSVSNLMMGRDKSTHHNILHKYTHSEYPSPASRDTAATRETQLDSICRQQPGPCPVTTPGLSSNLEKIGNKSSNFYVYFSTHILLF